MSKLKRLMMGAGMTALAIVATPAMAGNWWIHGDKIYNTGQVTGSCSGSICSGDAAELQRLLDRARAEGIVINGVVLRNNPGGVAVVGEAISTIIRRNGLNTIFQGGCFSACATMFLGGRQPKHGGL